MIEITPLGDSALIIRLPAADKMRSGPGLHRAIAVAETVRRARLPGVIECASAYNTVAVFFDPVEIMRTGATPGEVMERLSQEIRGVAEKAGQARRRASRGRDLVVPICSEGEFAPDLEQVAAHTFFTPHQVLELYCAASYEVASVGFTPGFPYLSGLPASLTTPRRATPRERVPPGSVAIGGSQTGIYPSGSPGGWNIIGRTPLVLFDPKREPAALLQPGDRVRFQPITHAQFEQCQSRP